MGLIYILVSGVANIMFKNLGMDNATAAFWSSLFILPYTLKPFWAPLLELGKNKKIFVLAMQFLLVGMIVATAFAVRNATPSAMMPLIVLLALSGILGATQDIATDGVYVTTLNSVDQAKYIGLQSMCWNAGPVIANGVLVRYSGIWNQSTGSWNTAWMYVLLAIAGIMGFLAVYHTLLLPPGSSKAAEGSQGWNQGFHTFVEAFSSFFQKKDIIRMLLFVFFFRFGYGFLDKIGPLFMIDGRQNGGLGLTNQSLGDINGTFGTGAFMVGSLLGGILVSRVGLKRTLLPLCLCLNVPNVVYLYFSLTYPTAFSLIAVCVSIDKFFWGVGVVGLSIYMMQQIAPGPYRTAHYTFASALMGLNMMLTGMISGKLEEWLGYRTFFIVILLMIVPSVLVTIAAPFNVKDEDNNVSARIEED
jgi:PAT family beta-lactamase induction signal transducer AmpG